MDMVGFDRIELPVVEGPAPAAAAPKAKKAPKAKPKAAAPPAAPAPAAPPAPKADREVVTWATFGVVFMLLLSAGLNGYANSLHAPAAWAGWLMGVSVPVIVLVLAKVAGSKWRKGERGVGGFAGGSGAGLLLLSVWHCSESIALLTGSGLFLAIPMAVAIDAGLVACEIALITEPKK
jgi:hypothetical protein